MALFAPLSVGKQALRAHERAIGVTGHNIANVNTKGYSRQAPLFHAARTDADGFGTGVEVSNITRSVDPFLEARRLANAASLGGATTGRQLLDRLQALFPVGDDGIGNALADFFAAANGVANSPQDIASRNELLEAGQAVAVQLRNAAGGIETLQREADQRLGQAALDANAKLQLVAQLNRQIVAAERSGRETADLRDQRQVALGDLASQLSIQVVELDDGVVNVFSASGQGLVLGADAATLATDVDPSQVGLDGNPLSRIGLVLQDGNVARLSGEIGGTIGTLLELRDTTFPDNAADLDRLAQALRDGVNAVQTNPAGRDLDGAVGLAFFSGAGAADLRVAVTDPRGIAAGVGANPADNANALALVAVGNQNFATLDNTTLRDFFGITHARVGELGRRADDAAAIEENVANALTAQREAISGVSLDEEFTDLIRFQRGFQAAAQLINVSNTLLEDLIGLVRA